MTSKRWDIIRTTSDEPIGLLYREWDESHLVTEYALNDGARYSSRIELNGPSWTRSTYTEPSESPVVLEAVNLLEEEDAIPSDLEFLLLHQAIRDSEPGSDATLSYHTIFAGDPRGRAREASMWQAEPNVWEIEVDGELESTHWVTGTTVTRSRIGAASYIPATVSDVRAALTARLLPEPVLSEFLAFL